MRFTVILTPDPEDGGYAAECPAIPGCISEGDMVEQALANIKEAIEGCRPLIAPHFNITVEIPLKAIVRGFTWTTIPVTWRNRRTGTPKLKIQEMGSRYLFICLYVWLEKYFSKGDYKRAEHPPDSAASPQRDGTVTPG